MPGSFLTIILAFLSSFLGVLIFVPPTIKFAKKFGFMDDPKRSHPAIIHKKPIPRVGGLALYFGMLIPIIVFIPLKAYVWGILIAGAITVLVGVLDDKFDINPFIRLATNFLVGLIIVISGIGIVAITNPFGGAFYLDSIKYPFSFFGNIYHFVLIADIFALFWIAWTMNMVNWSKGVDGQMPGIVFIAAVVLGILSIKFSPDDSMQWYNAILSFIVAGGALGFLLYNFYPAKIFPGYGASTFLGMMLAVLSILAGAKVATAILVLGIPTMDAVWTIIRRIKNKKSPFRGDMGHLHHLLLKIGWNQRKIALFYLLIGLVLGLFALSLTNTSQKILAIIFVALILAFILVSISILNRRRKK